MKSKRCGECGEFGMEYRDSTGPFPWRDFRRVVLKEPIQVLTCPKCANTGSLPGDAQKLDRAIEVTITFQSQQYIDQIIAREGIRQIDLAGILGVTPEHLSALKNGTRIPSYSTFNFLRTLAVNESAFRDAATIPRAASA
jgi:hypothetical protein